MNYKTVEVFVVGYYSDFLNRYTYLNFHGIAYREVAEIKDATRFETYSDAKNSIDCIHGFGVFQIEKFFNRVKA